MLSYDSPVPVNGQTAPSATNMSAHRQAVPTSPSAIRPAPSKAANGTQASSASAVNGHHNPKHHHVWLVTGPAGCGKSTVAKHLATALDFPYIEGDEVSPFPIHPPLYRR